MLTVSIHPFVFMSITDHFTRAKISNGKPTKVLGALFGKFEGNSV